MNKYLHDIAIDAASAVDLFNSHEPPDLQLQKFTDKLLTKILPAECTQELISTMLKALLECSCSDLEDLSPLMYRGYKDDVLRIYEALISNYYKKD